MLKWREKRGKEKRACRPVVFRGGKKRDRAPTFVLRPMTRFLNPWLQTGATTSPGSDRLPLLPSEPGGVHGLPPCGTRPSIPREKAGFTNQVLWWEFGPPYGDLRFVRGPRALRLARQRREGDSNSRVFRLLAFQASALDQLCDLSKPETTERVRFELTRHAINAPTRFRVERFRPTQPSLQRTKNSAPERTRTSGHQIRNLVLYPN